MNTNIPDNENIYIFIDTNLFYTRKNTYDFVNRNIDEILHIRDKFNHIFLNNKEIILLIPDIVLKEVQSIKKEHLVRDFNRFLKNIKTLEEDQFVLDLKQIKDKFDEKLTLKKDYFISSNEIIVPANCNNEYFENILKRAINKQIPFKPRYDSKKDRDVGDNGFKDAVIWYSIVDYVKNNITEDNNHIILLTNNKSDFKSDELLEEFYGITGKHIEICTINQEEFSNLILNQYKGTKIEGVFVSHLKLNDRIRINSVKVLPLDFNMHSFFPKCINAKEFEESFEIEVTSKLEKLKFNVESLNFTYHEPSIESINVELRNYKFWFLDILGIELNYDDGNTFYDYDQKNFNFGTDLSEIQEYENSFKKEISSYLEEEGYGPIDPEIIDYEIVEFIPPND